MTASPSLPPPSPPPARKGASGFGRIAIGCGTLITIAVILITIGIGWCRRTLGDFSANPEKAATEMIVKFHPDLTRVSSDDAKEEMTVRIRSGDEVTVSYKEISEGRFSVRDAQGKVHRFGKADLSSLPAWVPQPEEMEAAQGFYQTEDDNRFGGAYQSHGRSGQSLDEIESAFIRAAQEEGFAAPDRTHAGMSDMHTRHLAFRDDSRELAVALSASGGRVNAQVSYSGKK